MRTSPSGNTARISSCPPMASMKCRSVLTYISVRRSSLEIADCWTPRMVDRCSWVNARAARSSSSAISRIRRSAFASLRARDSGDIFACRSLTFFAIGAFTFLPELGQMLVIQPVRQGDVSLVPPIVPGLVAADQQDRRAPGVEGIEDAVGPSGVLHPELPHVRVPRGGDAGAIREPQRGPETLEQDYHSIHILLLLGRQALPPGAKRIGIFDRPFHRWNITGMTDQIPPDYVVTS